MVRKDLRECSFFKDLLHSMVMGAPLALMTVPEENREGVIEKIAQDSVSLATRIHDLVEGVPDDQA